MNAFELLKADHDKVAELFDQMESATGKAKLNIFKQIKNELEIHTHIEETIFYPALEKPEETHDLTLEAYEEHKVVKTLLAELARATSASDKWQAKAKVLQENVEHHVKEEENELFDKADDALTDEQIEVLGERMEAEKAKRLGSSSLKQPAAKTAGKKISESKPGILSRLANMVGLGEGAAKPKASKKPQASKKASSKTSVGSKKATTKTSAKTASKSNSRKTSNGASAKRSAAAHGSKRVPSSSRSRSTSSATKKSGKTKPAKK